MGVGQRRGLEPLSAILVRRRIVLCSGAPENTEGDTIQ